MHTFALVHAWRLLADAEKERTLQPVRDLQKDRANLKKYFISSVCEQPIEASRSVAESFVR